MFNCCKRWIALLLSLVMLVGFVPAPAASATETDAQSYALTADPENNPKTEGSVPNVPAAQAGDSELGGSCGENATWRYENGVLTISGTGSIQACRTWEETPWAECYRSVTTLVIEEGIIGIGASAFFDFDALTSVSLPSTMQHIGAEAFYGSDRLTTITIPENVIKIWDVAFGSMDSLSNVYFEGDAPEIIADAFEDSNPTMHYPSNRNWSDSVIGQFSTLNWQAYTPAGAEPPVTEPPVTGEVPATPTVATLDTGYWEGSDIPLSWQAVSNADNYRLRVRRDGNLIVDQLVTGTSYSISDAQAGSYTVSLTARNDAGESGESTITFPVVVPTIDCHMAANNRGDSVEEYYVGQTYFAYYRLFDGHSDTNLDQIWPEFAQTVTIEILYPNGDIAYSSVITDSENSIGLQMVEVGEYTWSIKVEGEGTYSETGTFTVLPSITGSWTTDVVLPAADLGVNAPDAVLRCTLTFDENGNASASWEAKDLSALKMFFHDMFVTAYYACGIGAGFTTIEAIEEQCMASTGMNVSAYMDAFLAPYDFGAIFTPPSATVTYRYNSDRTAIYTDLEFMGVPSNPAIANALTMQFSSAMSINAASYDKPDTNLNCNLVR